MPSDRDHTVYTSRSKKSKYFGDKMENLEDVALHLQRFTSFDYAFFISMLFLCIFIGLYFGFVKKREASAEMEYLMGGRKMSVFPISLSLIARFNSKKFNSTMS